MWRPSPSLARAAGALAAMLLAFAVGPAGAQAPGCAAPAASARATGRLLADQTCFDAPRRAPPGTDVAPIASDFPAAAWLQRAEGPSPVSAPPEPGAFRLICAASHANYDDPIVFPGQPGKSHLHVFYGNTDAGAGSTYQSIRRTGESSCGNRLNRSAYWAPALLTGQGQIVRPDYIALYYKRLPIDDPMCRRMAPGGCAPLPTGLRVVSGYDMARMGQPQPENAGHVFFRCISPGRPSTHHDALEGAIGDCGGEGQVMAAIGFGACWSGALDSRDHRAHLAHGRYRGQAYAQCDGDHPWLIPEVTQQLAYTVKRSDGPLRFSCDMAGMAAGSCFHADYMEGWDPVVRDRFERLCLDRRLSCSDGQLGDGTMLRHPPNRLTAAPRLVAAPPRGS